RVNVKMRNGQFAVLKQSKLCEYYLNTANGFGGSKARFFEEFGFRLDHWEVLTVTLKTHGAENEIVKMKETGFGPRYEIEGKLQAPDGRQPLVRSVWQLERGLVAPRLITAYPMEVKS